MKSRWRPELLLGSLENCYCIQFFVEPPQPRDVFFSKLYVVTGTANGRSTAGPATRRIVAGTFAWFELPLYRVSPCIRSRFTFAPEK